MAWAGRGLGKGEADVDEVGSKLMVAIVYLHSVPRGIPRADRRRYDRKKIDKN
jgi:hypothetical protein